ncbi:MULTISPECIES: DUF2946 family protein [Pseudomonas chlororaphis group]|uniref:DUF2946 family protein n=1 Tax=Pseudomonas chlororaphis group TaxID=136842 RepID=UPI0020984755|nr:MULTISPECIES: DUF2946 family protein [Pseudomonas chlororaphis group]MCO7577547.1 hypothetical protein [Pseudomonas protegens]MCO7583737.1 hypothetical protein [Pseudomonas chlororaphis]MCO7600930.1 hypothetical protein [Pseudomonas chlororaphis]
MIFNRHRRHARPTLDLLVCLLGMVLQAVTWASMPMPVAGSSASDEWLLVCTAQGMQRVSLAEFQARAGQDQDQNQDDSQGLGAAQGCALCPFVGGVALQPAWPLLSADGGDHGVPSAPADTRPPVSKSYDTSQARAPPAIG